MNNLRKILFVFIAMTVAFLLSNLALPANAAFNPPACGFSQQSGRIIIDFDRNRGLRADYGEDEATDSVNGVSIPAGNYGVGLHSYDNHFDKNQPDQTKEQFFVKFLNSNHQEIARSNSIGDIPDNAENMVQTVNNNLLISQDVDSLVLRHSAWPSSVANSVLPVCMALDRIAQPNNPPVISCSPSTPNVKVGEIAVINYAISDPDGDTFNIVVNWGDGTTSAGGSSSASHVYYAPGVYSIITTATDSKGATTSRTCGTIAVNQVGIIFVNSFEEGTSKPVIADFQILRNGQVVLGDQHSAAIEYKDQPSSRYELQVFPPASNSAYEYPPRFDVPDHRDLPPGNNRVGWNMYWRLKTATLTVNKAGSGVGAVTGLGINCGSDCSEAYPIGNTIQLTASPDAGSVFAGWSGACTHPQNCIITMDSAKSVTATFNAISNQPPKINSCNPRTNSIVIGNSITLDYNIDDPENDPFTVTIDWGDGTTSAGGSSSASHAYNTAGTFTVSITARDSKGATTSRNCDTIIVKDIKNKPPLITCSPSTPNVRVGETAIINYQVSDPDNDAVTVTIDWGDGTSSTGGSGSATHIYSRTGTFSVSITATDSKGASATKSCGIIKVTTIPNKPPVISTCNTPTPSVRTGETAIINYQVSDPDNDAVTVTIDWGDGTTSSGGPSSGTHIYSVAGTHSITITATDAKGATVSKFCGTIRVITAPNTPPSISSCSAPPTIRAGETAVITYQVSDADNDVITITVNWGDGTTSTGGAGSASHVYSTQGTYSVTIIAVDGRGATTSRFCGTIAVSSAPPNNPPTISSCNPPSGSIPVGSSATITYSVSDPDGDSVAITVDWGDGATSTGGSTSASHTYSSTGTFSISITARDSRGATTSRTCGTITITSTSNNPPSISSCTPPSGSIPVGSSATITYSVSDPDGDSVSITVNWGDGTTSTGGASSASHAYSSAGTYTVTITATDSRGLSTSRNCGTITVGSGTAPSAPECPKIKITDVDAKVDGRSDRNLKDNDDISKDASPGSRIELKVTVKNLYNISEDNDLEDAQVTATIEGINDGGDLEEESREFDLSPEDDKSVTFKFQVPESVEEGNYDIAIEAEGRDEKRKCSSHEDDIDIGLEVEKEKNKLALTRLSLNKVVINCTESFVLSYEITNFGSEEQRAAYVEIRNDDLGLNFVQKDISVDAGTENNKLSKSHTLKVSGTENGAYPLTVNLYSDDGQLQDSETTSLELKNCPKAPEKTKEEKIATQQQTSTINVIGTDTIEEVYRFPLVNGYLGGSRKNLMLLVLSTFILSVFFLFVAIVALIKAEEE
ncbi:PKD domain-containing protein [Candidatus Woesearchaeota archaeon]|nr:PKD domain-containing protein [Candidatus Woesearchaeota archaeon]